MNENRCTRCGQGVPAGYTRCPICGNELESRTQAGMNASQRRYVIWFALLTIFCIVVALLLPR